MGFIDGIYRGMGISSGSSHHKEKSNDNIYLGDLFGTLDDDNDDIVDEAVYSKGYNQKNFRKNVADSTDSNNGWYICPKCKKHFRLKDMDADHIISRHYGGTTSRSNGQMLCSHCNRSKQSNGKDSMKDTERRMNELKSRSKVDKIKQRKDDADFLKAVMETKEFKETVNKERRKNEQASNKKHK